MFYPPIENEAKSKLTQRIYNKKHVILIEVKIWLFDDAHSKTKHNLIFKIYNNYIKIY